MLMGRLKSLPIGASAMIVVESGRGSPGHSIQKCHAAPGQSTKALLEVVEPKMRLVGISLLYADAE